MRFYFLILVILVGCKSNNQKLKKNDTNVTVKSSTKQLRATPKELNNKQRTYPYPQILSESIKGLNLVHHAWESKFVLDLGNRLVQFIKPLDTSRFLVVSRGDTNMQFYLTDANVNGVINYEIMIDEPNWYIDKQLNFIRFKDGLHFYLENDTTEWVYDLKGHLFKADKRELDWLKIEQADWQSDQDEISHSGDLKFTFNGGTDLVLEDLSTGKKTEFIKQEYLGNWAFGTGCWSTDDSKFYFDNSGPVACIWEVDLLQGTLDKVVAEHEAAKPNYVHGTKNSTLIYYEKGYIKIAERKQKLTSLFNH